VIGADSVVPTSEASFLRTLIRQLRAQEAGGEYDGRSDGELLAPLIVPRAERDARIGEPDPEVFLRMELFYSAVGICIEQRTGRSCSPMLNMHHAGFGRLVLIAGRLVVLAKHLRDVQRFGFDSVASLAMAGEKLIAEGTEMIERHPELARMT